jgi:hypothetical protein
MCVQYVFEFCSESPAIVVLDDVLRPEVMERVQVRTRYQLACPALPVLEI